MKRFQRILVPLDGSLRAERALPLAARIARASRGSLILLCVVEAMPEKNADVTPTSVLESGRVRAQWDEAQHYLRALALTREFAGIPLTVAVQAGPVIPTIMATAQSSQADLLILCGPQGSQVHGLPLQRMTEQCLGQTPIPLLLVPAHGAVLHRQNHPFTLLLAFEQTQVERSLLEPAITLLAALAVREQEPSLGTFSCILRAFPAYNRRDQQKSTDTGWRDHLQQQSTTAPLAEKQRERSLETSKSRCEGDVLVLGVPSQPERAQWMDEHRKNAMFAACDLPLLFVPVPAQGQVGATK